MYTSRHGGGDMCDYYSVGSYIAESKNGINDYLNPVRRIGVNLRIPQSSKNKTNKNLVLKLFE